MCSFLYLIFLLNFSLDPRVDLIAVILVVGSLILLKGVTAKRVYKESPLDVMETAIYFNLVAFSALTWYNLDFGGNQVAVAYIYICHGNFYPLTGDYCLSYLALHQAL